MNRETKINQILKQIPKGSVLLSSWLAKQGYSYSLQQSYRHSSWFTSVGRGVMVRSGDQLLLSGAISALQLQAELPLHIGGRSALGLLGYSHYVELYSKETLIFSNTDIHIPKWLFNIDWDSKPIIIKTSFLPDYAGLTNFDANGINLKISGAARAILECLELAPAKFDLYEAWEIMQGLSLLQPETVNLLLINCRSVKVKRLFLYFAEKAGHAWFKKINKEKINLGKGKRSITRKGVYVPEYMITLPENLV